VSHVPHCLVWDVYEQVCVAALDCGDLETAESCHSKLKNQFPGSVRVQKLRGMILEASGKYSEAFKFYEAALEAEPTSSVLWKRKVAVFKAMGDTDSAISELNALLSVFMSDHEAWTELADLYLEKNNYEKAAFCLEELLLVNPHHHLHHQRYAEVCYSQKTVESLEVARKHFAMAAKLNPNNMRALYGFYMVRQ
jgi:tetratricopeptide (TPR) repeat protein